MKLLSTLTTGVLLFATFVARASGPGPIRPINSNSASPDTIALKSDSSAAQLAGSNGNNSLVQYKNKSVPLYKRLEFGLKAGVNVSSNNPNPHSTQAPPFLFHPEFGAVFGPTMTLPVGKYFAGMVGVLYSQNVFSGEVIVDKTGYLYLNTLSYAEVPFELQIKPIKQITLFFGGYASFLIRNKYAYVTSPVSPEVQQAAQSVFAQNNISGAIFGIDLNIIYNVSLGMRITTGVPNNSTTNPQNISMAQFTLDYTFR